MASNSLTVDRTEIRKSEKPASGLYIAATPIGNLADVTIRVIETMAGADLIACEDRRVTARLLARHNITTPTVSYHDHNAAKVRPGLIRRLQEGQVIVLVSDAGTPLISDPGYRLVNAARAAAVPVTALPGASSVLGALMVAGLPTDRFLFVGFLPTKAGQRRRGLAEIAVIPATLVIFESARRLASSLGDMATALGGDREAAIVRELTKLHEEVRRGSLGDLGRHYAEAGPPKGEVVIVVAPPPVRPAAAADIDAALRQALAQSSLSSAAAAVAAAFGIPRRQAYRRALALAADHEKR